METDTSENMEISETVVEETPIASEDVVEGSAETEAMSVSAEIEQLAVPMEGVEATTTEPANEQEGGGSVAEQQQQQQPLGESMSRSPSSESIASSGNGRLYPGLAGLLKDPFLIQVEQELSCWEAVVG